MSNRFRGAVGSLFTECNHFVSKPIELTAFQRQQLCRGRSVLEVVEGTVGGMLAYLHDHEVDVAPLLVASACPSGPLTTECYRWLKTELLEDLRAAMPVDGVLLALHGAATAENIGDLEGDLLTASDIALRYWRRRAELEPLVYSPAEVIELGLAIGGPVLLVETADCCGGGAAGDSVAALRALLEADIDVPSLVPVVAPLAAAACHQAGYGQTVTVELGHQVDPRWGRPIAVTGKVVRLGDGRFSYTGAFGRASMETWDHRPCCKWDKCRL